MNRSVNFMFLVIVVFAVEVAVLFLLFQRFFAVYILGLVLFLFFGLGYVTGKESIVRLLTRISLSAFVASAIVGLTVN